MRHIFFRPAQSHRAAAGSTNAFLNNVSGSTLSPPAEQEKNLKPDSHYRGLSSFMRIFNLKEKPLWPKKIPATAQLVNHFDTSAIRGIKSIPTNPETGKPLWKDTGANIQKPLVRVFTLTSPHPKYAGLTLEQRLDHEIEASTTGGILRTADNRINQVGIASTRIGVGSWYIWSGDIGFVFSPDTPVSLRSKKAFFSDGLIEKNCYQHALKRQNNGKKLDFKKVHRAAENARHHSPHFFDSDADESIKLFEMTLRQNKAMPDLPTKTLLLEAIKEADPQFDVNNMGCFKKTKKKISKMLIQKGEQDRLALLFPVFKKMKSKDKPSRRKYLEKAEEIMSSPDKSRYQKYSKRTILSPNEQLILPGKDGKDNVAAILLTGTEPENCRLGMLLRERFEKRLGRTLPFAVYDKETGELEMLSVANVQKLAKGSL